MQTLLIFSLAFAGAGGSALLHPRPEPTQLVEDEWMRTVEQVVTMDDFLWVDARTPDVFAEKHIEGAVNVSLQDWDHGFGEMLAQWSPDAAIVVYCDGEGCELSKEAAARLRSDLGDDRVYWLFGGIEAWEEHSKQ
ncbi:rhodanese-like domain-containing protein [Cerasicoccus frondis]|uniref:rhodanese-like domain-containing protein n=1 Tax=Cerasicoccus frondis TaxID=490090 RepID=UPI0028527EB6|nr:rhodanese-like domain-containing protein [Cerasicoccus frondis]